MDQVFTRYFRSSHQFSVKVVLKNLANFIVKTLCRSLFLINLQAWRHATLSKRDPNTGSMRFPKFSEHLFWRTFANNCSRCFKRSHWTLHWGFCILMFMNFSNFLLWPVYASMVIHCEQCIFIILWLSCQRKRQFLTAIKLIELKFISTIWPHYLNLTN